MYDRRRITDNCYTNFYDKLVDMGTRCLWASGDIGVDSVGRYYITNPGVAGSIFFYWGYPNIRSSTYTIPSELSGYVSFRGISAYDAATAHLGSGWATPSMSDFNDLLYNCNIEVTQSGEIKLVSKITQNALFFDRLLFSLTSSTSGYDYNKAYNLLFDWHESGWNAVER